MGSNYISNSVTLYPHILDWLCGELLGDGCLRSNSTSSAKFQYSSKYMEYAWYIARTLDSYGIKQSGKIYKNLCKWGVGYSYQSRAYSELRTLYDLWYPKGKKIVPEGLMLTPITCRQWYIGDGCLDRTQGKNPYITIATQAFPTSDVDRLVGQLINVGVNATRQSARNNVYVRRGSVKRFLDYIGQCPVACYKYKWDLGGVSI